LIGMRGIVASRARAVESIPDDPPVRRLTAGVAPSGTTAGNLGDGGESIVAAG
jgi:hypothetical protein